MIFNSAIVKLDYGNLDLESVKAELGPCLSISCQAYDDDLVYIQIVNKKVKAISRARAAKEISAQKGEIYAISQQKYIELTSSRANKSAMLKPHVSDNLSEQVSKSFASDTALIAALLLTAWLLPIINLVAAPLVFGVSCFALNMIRYRTTFGRWPNTAEVSSIIGHALDASISLSISLLLYSMLTGASIFAPLAIHAISIGTASYGGPLVTYLIAPLAIAAVTATGITIYKDSAVILGNFFELNFQLSKSFPFLFNIKLKKERNSLFALIKTLAFTTLTEFSLNFIVILAAVYLSYIPGGAIAGYLFGTGAANVASTLLSLSLQITVGLVNTLVFTIAIDKTMNVLNKIPLKKFWNHLFNTKTANKETSLDDNEIEMEQLFSPYNKLNKTAHSSDDGLSPSRQDELYNDETDITCSGITSTPLHQCKHRARFSN